MTNSADRRPFSMPYVGHTANISTSTSGTLIARAPWPAPVNKYFVLRKLLATQIGAASGASLAVWDQDLSNTTPVARGSAGGPLLTVPITPIFQQSGIALFNTATMTVLDIDACPQEMFQAGIMAYTPASGVSVSFEADVV